MFRSFYKRSSRDGVLQEGMGAFIFRAWIVQTITRRKWEGRSRLSFVHYF